MRAAESRMKPFGIRRRNIYRQPGDDELRKLLLAYSDYREREHYSATKRGDDDGPAPPLHSTLPRRKRTKQSVRHQRRGILLFILLEANCRQSFRRNTIYAACYDVLIIYVIFLGLQFTLHFSTMASC